MPIESIANVGLDDDGGLDEVVVTGGIRQFHIERMDTGSWWMALYMVNGTSHVINLSALRPGTTRVDGQYEYEPA